jgi:cell division protein FtsQ
MRLLGRSGQSRQSVQPPRHHWRRIWRRWQTRALTYSIALVMILGAAIGSVQAGWAMKAWVGTVAFGLSLSGDLGLVAKRIEIEGRQRANQGQVIAALDITGRPGLLSLDLEAMRQRLRTLPWVGDAVIERRYPDSLIVRLSELQPFALWQHQRRFYLIARDGRLIKETNARDYRHLPMVVGPGAPQRATEILDLMASTPALGRRVTAAVLVGERRWNLRLDNGIDVKLPEIAPEKAWRRLAELAAREQLLDKDISIIDLRFEDRVVVRLAHPIQPETPADGAGKET